MGSWNLIANHVDCEGLWFGDCCVGGYPIAPTSSLADYAKIRWELVGRQREGELPCRDLTEALYTPCLYIFSEPYIAFL